MSNKEVKRPDHTTSGLKRIGGALASIAGIVIFAMLSGDKKK